MKLKKFIKRASKKDLRTFIKHQGKELDMWIEEHEKLEKEHEANIKFLRRLFNWE